MAAFGFVVVGSEKSKEKRVESKKPRGGMDGKGKPLSQDRGGFGGEEPSADPQVSPKFSDSESTDEQQLPEWNVELDGPRRCAPTEATTQKMRNRVPAKRWDEGRGKDCI